MRGEVPPSRQGALTDRAQSYNRDQEERIYSESEETAHICEVEAPGDKHQGEHKVEGLNEATIPEMLSKSEI